MKKIRDEGYTFTGLPQYKPQTDETMQYEIVESTYPGFTSLDVTNQGVTSGDYLIANTMQVREARIDKIWVDNNNRDNTRPSSITASLTRDGIETMELTLQKTTASNDVNVWTTGTFYVPLYQQDAAKGYSVYTSAEQQNITGYTMSNVSAGHTSNDPLKDTGNTNYFTYTNTLTNTVPSVTDVHVVKKWSDGILSDVSRPSQVYFTLYARHWDTVKKAFEDTWTAASAANCGLTGSATIALDPSQTDTVSWDNVWTYYPQDTAEPEVMQYQVEETDAAGSVLAATYPYEVSHTANIITATDAGKTVTFTNTLKKTVNASVQKTWKTAAGTSSAVMTEEEKDLYLSQGELPKQLRYTVQYLDHDTWKNVTKGNGLYTVDADISTAEKLNAYTGSSTADDLPAYDGAGNLMQYRLIETAVNDTDASNTGWIDITKTNLSMTNSQTETTNTLLLGSVTVSKQWLDEADRDGLRTNQITIQLLRDGQAYGDSTVLTKKADGTWPSYTWKNVPVNQKGSSSRSQYSIQESAVEGYQAESTSVTADLTNAEPSSQESTIQVSNTHIPDTFALHTEKVWEDDDNTYNTRTQISFTLQYQTADGTWKNVEHSTLNKELYGDDGVYTSSENPQVLGSGTEAVWSDLRKKSQTAALIYRVEETGSPDAYETSYDVTGAQETDLGTNTFTAVTADTVSMSVTNTLTKTSLTVTKNWADYDNQYLTRPSSDLTVQLQSRTSTEENWEDVTGKTAGLKYDPTTGIWAEAVFTDLPVKDDKDSYIMYQAVETQLPVSYEAASEDPDGSHCIITNTLQMEKKYSAVIKKHSLTVDGPLLDGAGFLVRRVRDPVLKTSTLPVTAETAYEYYKDYNASTDTVTWTDDESQAKMFVTGTDVPYVLGQVTVPGLTLGEYTIIEVQAPQGYALNDSVDFTITGKTAQQSVNVAQADPLLPESEEEQPSDSNEAVTSDGTNTGDQTAAGMWLGVMIISAYILLLTGLMKRKFKK